MTVDDVIEKVKVLHVEEGDVLVFKVDGSLSSEAMIRLKKIITGTLGKISSLKAVEILLIDSAIDIEVVRKGKE